MQTSTDEPFFAQDSEAISQRIRTDLEQLPESNLTLPEKVALACRLLADEGHADTLAGQITVRGDAASTFWTPCFSAGFSEVGVADMLRIDDQMRPVQGRGMANPAIRFHLWVYAQRPDVNCIVHTHARYASALGMTEQELIVAHMDATMFHNDCAFLREWPGVPLANEEGRIISQALGDNRSILLAHHGLLTTGKSLEEAVYLAVLLEHAARLQLLAGSVAPIKPIPAHLAQEAHDFLLQEKIVLASFASWARRMARKYPEALERDG